MALGWSSPLLVPVAESGLTASSRPQAKLLTKGDNNAADDTELYARGQDYLNRKDIVG